MTYNSHKDDKNVNSAQQKPSKKGGWKVAIFLLFIAVVERFSFFGLSANLVTYLTNELHQPTSTTAKNVNIWTSVSNIVPLFSASVADSFLGRFKTIVLACVIYLVADYEVVGGAGDIKLSKDGDSLLKEMGVS
nr:protein nrt1/ ptr family 5.4 [Quercus suber]